MGERKAGRERVPKLSLPFGPTPNIKSGPRQWACQRLLSETHQVGGQRHIPVCYAYTSAIHLYSTTAVYDVAKWSHSLCTRAPESNIVITSLQQQLSTMYMQLKSRPLCERCVASSVENCCCRCCKHGLITVYNNYKTAAERTPAASQTSYVCYTCLSCHWTSVWSRRHHTSEQRRDSALPKDKQDWSLDFQTLVLPKVGLLSACNICEGIPAVYDCWRSHVDRHNRKIGDNAQLLRGRGWSTYMHEGRTNATADNDAVALFQPKPRVCSILAGKSMFRHSAAPFPRHEQSEWGWKKTRAGSSPLLKKIHKPSETFWSNDIIHDHTGQKPSRLNISSHEA